MVNILIAILFAGLYAIDIVFLVWLSFRFVALSDTGSKTIFAVAISQVLFIFLGLVALFQVPLDIKPLILLIMIFGIIAIYVHLIEQYTLKAVAAATFFLFSLVIVTILFLRYLWNFHLVQQLKLIFIKLLY